jgi:hypothetical protein
MYAQYVLKNDSDVGWYKSIPQERVFVHHNTSLLFSGEYLYYKLYCFNESTDNLSKTSKIAYVELIGEHGQIIFKHKIKLIAGLGQGDFFVPTSIPSGNYKLLAYTQWMKNASGNNFFSSDISIINPYRGNQREILSKDIEIEKTPKNNSQRNNYNSKLSVNNIETADNLVKLYTDIESYKSRSKVVLTIKATSGINSLGNYSISVRKIDTILTASMPTSVNYKHLFNNIKKKSKTVGDEIFMPEFKGEMFTGKVLNKNTNLPEPNKDIALSIINNESFLDITKTNKDGIFYFHITTNYYGDDAIFQVVDKHPENYIVKLNEHQPMSPKKLKYYQFKMTSKMKSLILERSINNQIQNGFFSVKPDTIKTITPQAPFYGNHQDVYNLDDYTRFPDVKETVIEIIEHAWTKKDNNGKQVFVVRGREFDPYYGSDLLPLVMVDGVFIQDHERIIEYQAKKVKSISVLRDEYYYGSQIYKGIINIKTIKGEFDKELSEAYLKKVKLFKPRPKKNYFNQWYDDATKKESSRIPDFRQQLLWMPEFKLRNIEQGIEFFTSDIKGVYEITFEGFTNQGKPISVKKTFSVN